MKGFTFIEMVVSVSIILLLAGGVIAGYNGFNDRQIVAQAAATVKSDLRAVSASASTGRKPENCETLVGYKVQFTAPDSYTSQAVCSAGGVESLTGQIFAYVLSRGVQFYPGVPTPIVFFVLNRGASGAQTITVRRNGISASISVSASGLVDEVK